LFVPLYRIGARGIRRGRAVSLALKVSKYGIVRDIGGHPGRHIIVDLDIAADQVAISKAVRGIVMALEIATKVEL